MRRVLWILVSLLLLLLIGCGDKQNPPNQPTDSGFDGGIDGGVDGGTDGGTDGGIACVNTVGEVPLQERSHICFDFAECERENPMYTQNPPASGPHFWVWARWQIYTEPVPRGYWVHNLEHGGVVFLYRPDAPQSLVESLTRVYEMIPPDPVCLPEGLAHRRAVLTPDPQLDVPWAVTVSLEATRGIGLRIKSDCIESEQKLVDFAVQNRRQSVEDLCADGFYPP